MRDVVMSNVSNYLKMRNSFLLLIKKLVHSIVSDL